MELDDSGWRHYFYSKIQLTSWVRARRRRSYSCNPFVLECSKQIGAKMLDAQVSHMDRHSGLRGSPRAIACQPRRVAAECQAAKHAQPRLLEPATERARASCQRRVHRVC